MGIPEGEESEKGTEEIVEVILMLAHPGLPD